MHYFRRRRATSLPPAAQAKLPPAGRCRCRRPFLPSGDEGAPRSSSPQTLRRVRLILTATLLVLSLPSVFAVWGATRCAPGGRTTERPRVRRRASLSTSAERGTAPTLF